MPVRGMRGASRVWEIAKPILQIVIAGLLFIAFIAFYWLILAQVQADIDVAGSVEKVVAVHGDEPYSIVTVDGEDYRYGGEVAPEEGDEILFTRDGELTGLDRMTEWHLAD